MSRRISLRIFPISTIDNQQRRLLCHSYSYAQCYLSDTKIGFVNISVNNSPRIQSENPCLSRRCYSTEHSPFTGHSRDSGRQTGFLGTLRRLLGRKSKETESTQWEKRKDGDINDGYEPDAEWESLQKLSNLIRTLKAEVKEENDLNIEELEDVEFELKKTIDVILNDRTIEELSVVHVRLINEAWKILYTAKIGSVQESSETQIVHSDLADRRHFNMQELTRLLELLAMTEIPSEHHVWLGKRVYQAIMSNMTGSDPKVKDVFMVFVLLLSKAKHEKELLTAFDGLLKIILDLDEKTATALVTIINNVSDEKIQEVLVSRVFGVKFADIGAFNIVLQSAIENDRNNIWTMYEQLLKQPEGSSLQPNLDTYELLLRYVVKDPESKDSKEFMLSIKKILFDDDTPAYDIAETQILYRSYLTAAMVTNDMSAAILTVNYLTSEEMKPELEFETWQVLAQWTAYFTKDITKVLEFLFEMNEYGHTVDTISINGIMRAAQIGESNREFREQVFGLYDAYNVPLDTNSVSLRIRDLVVWKKPLAALEIFKRSQKEFGLVWNPLTDDMKALFLMLQELCSMDEFDPQCIVETYLMVRVYVNNVDLHTRLIILKAFLEHGEIGNAKDFLNQEFGKDFKYLPDAFAEMYDVLNRYLLDSRTAEQAWMIYGCLHEHFIPAYESYLPIMQKMCRLEYPSAAMELFRHVRRETNTPPQKDMYALLFREFARQNYVTGIDELLLCYKVDLNIDPDTELFNAMLEACLPSDNHYLSYNLWQQIRLAASSQSSNCQPNSETFALLLKTASIVGSKYADAVWEEMKHYPVKLTPEHYMYYVAAQCESQDYIKALKVAKSMPALPRNEPVEDSAERPSSVGDVISVLYNYSDNDQFKTEVKYWAELVHPQEWKSIETDTLPLLEKMRVYGHDQFKNAMERKYLEERKMERQNQLKQATTKRKPLALDFSDIIIDSGHKNS
ncbi:hypothetical protein V1511DRAFT_493875 [Dipodascopsis uninucleata]